MRVRSHLRQGEAEWVWAQLTVSHLRQGEAVRVWAQSIVSHLRQGEAKWGWAQPTDKMTFGMYLSNGLN